MEPLYGYPLDFLLARRQPDGIAFARRRGEYALDGSYDVMQLEYHTQHVATLKASFLQEGDGLSFCICIQDSSPFWAQLRNVVRGFEYDGRTGTHVFQTDQRAFFQTNVTEIIKTITGVSVPAIDVEDDALSLFGLNVHENDRAERMRALRRRLGEHGTSNIMIDLDSIPFNSAYSAPRARSEDARSRWVDRDAVSDLMASRLVPAPLRAVPHLPNYVDPPPTHARFAGAKSPALVEDDDDLYN